jgi:hypothetical protein
MISVNVETKPISASVQSGQITGQMGSSLVITSAAGGIGPQGVQGPAASIALASDVALTSVTDGDVLRWSNSRWRNYHETQLTDGGHF